MSRLALYLLGPPRLELDGEEIHVSRRKAMALLVYLAVTGRSHSRDSLATLLWPELDQSTARARLRRALAALREAIGDGWLDADRETVGLAPDAEVWLDVDRFRDLLAASEAHDHPSTDVCPDCLPLLEEAVELYRDDFLAGFTLRDSPAFDEFQFFQTEGLKDELAGALERLVRYHSLREEYERAIAHARRWLALDPLHEPVHHHLMRLYGLSGQRAAALRQYETCRDLLAEELGVEPSEQARETYELLLKGESLPDLLVPIAPARKPRVVGTCPYRGLAAFREEDAPFFFGREDFTQRLDEAVRERPLVAVIVGSSGSGKSSAVFAGLLPRLREEAGWIIADSRPGAQPFHAVAAALLPLLEPGLSETDRLVETNKLAKALSAGDVSLIDVAERALEKHAQASRLLLVIDQFEELYTLCPDPATRRAFVDILLQATSPRPLVSPPLVPSFSSLHLLLTLRADFMGQALLYRPFADAVQESALMLGPMTREEMRAAIERPAEKQGAAFEAGLVERVLDDVGEEPGNLPLLEFALTLLWERNEDGWLTHGAYEEIGRVEGALTRYADEVYGTLGEEERERARQVFVQLVQPGEGTEDTRRVATRAELGDENWGVIQHLADRRLVVTGRDEATGSETAEVVHEALIGRWGQLRGWMEEDRAFRTWQERLRVALSQWQETGEDEGVLLRGAPLAEAEGWMAERGTELSTSERAFIRASIGLRERRETERDRRRRRTILALAGGLVVALILVLVTVQQRQNALVQASIGLASQAMIELEGTYPERAVLLALEALENYPYTWQAERALGQAVLGNRLRLILRHGAPVYNAWWSPDGTRILTVGAMGTSMAKVWDANASSPTYGEELLMLSGHQDEILAAIWSPSGDRIVTASADGTAKVWDASASSPTYGEELLTFASHRSEVFDAQWSPDGKRIATASDDGTAAVWDTNASSPTYGEELLILLARAERGGVGKVSGVAWSPDGARIVTTYSGGIVWDVSASSPTYGEVLLRLRDASGVKYAMWSPDGTRIVTVSYDIARVWDATASSPTYGEVLFTLPRQTGDWQSVAWSPSGETIATGDWGGNAKIWDAATGDELLDLYPEDHAAVAVMDIVWSPSGDRLATVCFDGTATVWDVATGAELLTLVGHTSVLRSAAWSHAGDRLVTACVDGTAKVWDVASGPELLTLYGHTPAVNTVMWSPSGDRLVTSGDDGMTMVWDATTGERLLIFGSGTNAAIWSPSGDQIVTGHQGGLLKEWDASTGKFIRTILTGHSDAIFYGGVAWSPDGRRIATASYDATAKVFDATTGQLVVTLVGHEDAVAGVAWSPDGARIVTTSWDGTARVWDATTGGELRSLFTLDSPLEWVLWSADGSRIVTNSADSVGRVWDATTGKLLATFVGSSNVMASGSWSPIGDRFLTGCLDGTARIWDLDTGAELMRYSPGGVVHQVDWSPDGTCIATANQDGATRVFPAWQTTQELIDYAKECCIVRELTAEEQEQFGLPAR